MTSAASTISGSAPAPSQRWLFGAAPDWILGCGGFYVGALALQFALGADLSRWVPGGILVLLFSLPHYGATLLRAYEQPGDRQRYWLFIGPATAVLAALFVAGLQWGLLGSLLLTLYLTWSPWHYTGQNYGVFLMLAGRRGVPISGTAKRLLWWSFVFSYALTFVAMHSVAGGNYTPLDYEGTAFTMLPIGLVGSWIEPLLWVLALGTVTSLGAALWLTIRDQPHGAAALKALAPSLGVAALQATWFSLPVAARLFGPELQQSALVYIYSGYGFLWIAAGHSIQYLWVTTYYAVGREGAAERARFLGKSALAGFAIWTVPGLLFAPSLLGRIPYESGLAVLIAALVNLHHFVLDGALWKLRDGRVARVLLGSESAEAAEANPRLAWVWPATRWVGAACIVLSLVSFWESEFGFGRSFERKDLARASTAVERIAMLGRDGPARHTKLAALHLEGGDPDAARAALERSLELRPTALAYRGLGQLEEREGRWPAATEAYARALELAGDDVQILYRFGLSALESGEPERARDALERAVELAPANSLLRPALAKAKREVKKAGGDSGSPGA